jgi:hypothetical protein
MAEQWNGIALALRYSGAAEPARGKSLVVWAVAAISTETSPPNV